jgi:hypothetical protein
LGFALLTEARVFLTVNKKAAFQSGFFFGVLACEALWAKSPLF